MPCRRPALRLRGNYGATGLDQGQSRWIKVNQTSFMGRETRVEGRADAEQARRSSVFARTRGGGWSKVRCPVRGLGCRAGGRRSAFVGLRRDKSAFVGTMARAG